MYPEIVDGATAVSFHSAGEEKFYRACRIGLPDRYLVLHSVQWLFPDSQDGAREGEADFIVFDESRGYLFIEVKGGGVSVDRGSKIWHSVDRFGVRHEIKNPFDQARRAKYTVNDYIRRRDRHRAIDPRCVVGYAVVFPDLHDLAKLDSIETPSQIMAGHADLVAIEAWMDRVFGYFQGQRQGSALGKAGISFIEATFCNRIEVKPLLSNVVQSNNETQLRLTEEQSRIIRALGRQNRAAVSGGAGTGKTLLAVEKARRLAESGLSTLLLCYNRPLGDFLADVVLGTDNLFATNFHQLCLFECDRVRQTYGEDPLVEAHQMRRDHSLKSSEHFDLCYPQALLRCIDRGATRYDAIVVDEGQDFQDSYWDAVEFLLKDQPGILFIFYDENQTLYRRATNFPVRSEPAVLFMNCRNTKAIHDAAYTFYIGDEVMPPPISGAPIEYVEAPTMQSQASKIGSLVLRLIDRENVSPAEIVVLVASTGKEEYYEALAAQPLPKHVNWAIEDPRTESSVLVDTVYRFKGLEAAAIILWGVGGAYEGQRRELLYVGLSRARSLLYICDSQQTCQSLREEFQTKS